MDDLQLLLAPHFDLVVESSKTGLRKPNHAIYQLACEKLGIQPHEVILNSTYTHHNASIKIQKVLLGN